MTSNTSSAQLAAALPGLVEFAFDKASGSGKLNYFESEVQEIPVNGVVFQVRFAPGLAKKPKEPKREGDDDKPVDPFATPEPELFVADLGENHYLVLNKFPIVRHHFILATKAFKEQTHVLEQDDLAEALFCINAYAAQGRELFAFFNCGPESGASQPHRHLQLLPVDGMVDGLDGGGVGGWQLLTDHLLQAQERGSLPFAVLVDWLAEPDAESLYIKYLSLYGKAFTFVHGRAPAAEDLKGPAAFSYNLALTRNTLALCPRTADGGAIAVPGGPEVGRLSLNGTLLAGTALVRTREEFECLAANPAVLARALSQIGLPPLAVM